MRKNMIGMLRARGSRHASIRRRLFWLLWGMSLGTLLVVNLAWLPGALQDIRDAQSDLQRVAVRGVRDQMQLFLDDKEQALKSQAMLFRPAFFKEIRRAPSPGPALLPTGASLRGDWHPGCAGPGASEC
jgi:hypothetical protein